MSTQRNPRASEAGPSRPQQPQELSPTQAGSLTPRSMVTVSLVLAVVFIIAVVGGAKIISDKQKYSAVSVGPVEAPLAGSPDCQQLIEELPDKAGKFRKVDILDPAPEGVGAYRDTDGTQLTLRCGVDVPEQFSVLSSVSSFDGASWFIAQDATPGSSLATWYSVSGAPTVALTSEASSKRLSDAAAELSQAVGTAQDTGAGFTMPRGMALVDEPMAKQKKAGSCNRFLENLPGKVEGYQRVNPEELNKRLEATAMAVGGSEDPKYAELIQQANRAAEQGTAVYLPDTPGFEPVIVRCGVEFPEAYEQGERLTQIDEVPWFDAPALAEGSTAGTWYALGHERVVAVSMPQFSSESFLPQITKAISESLASD